MKARLIVLPLLLAALGLSAAAVTSNAHGQPAGSPDTYVANWDAIGTQAFTAAGLSPAEGHVIFAYVAIAAYDSVMAVKGGYQPFAVEAHAQPGVSAQAAVAAAAHRILSHYLPLQAPTILDPAYASSVATIPDGDAKTDGVAVGENIADLLIALRARDGFRAPVTYTPPNPPVPECGSRRRRRRRSAPTSAGCDRSAWAPQVSSGRTVPRRSRASAGRVTTTR
jgi:hypothetical protein